MNEVNAEKKRGKTSQRTGPTADLLRIGVNHVKEWTPDEELEAIHDAQVFLKKSLDDNGIPIDDSDFFSNNVRGLVFEDELSSIYRGRGYTQRGEKAELWSDSDHFLYGGMGNAVRIFVDLMLLL